jgi:hypothetical protein
MNTSNRREFLRYAAAGSIGWTIAAGNLLVATEKAAAGGGLRLATFRLDVTPPLGHSCCGGWIRPVEAVDDALEALGIVLLGCGPPLVLCAVDWTGLLNGAHLAWRTALAEAAGTTPDRVAVQCVHQHNAPFACLDAQRIVAEQGDLPHIVLPQFFEQCLERAQQAVRQALNAAHRLTHLAAGQGRVEQVAANRRVARDDNGRVRAMRGSSCRDEQLRALPEGTIDPWLKTLALYHQDRKLAALHYYATHPMSHYGDGRVSSDFVGLARKQRQQDQPDCLHVYFTGCAGDVAAGKYNDGSPEMRPVLTQRVYDGIVASERSLRPVPIERVAWRTVEILPPPRAGLSAETLQRQIDDASHAVVNRNRPAYTLAWLRRLEQRIPIVLGCLQVNQARLLNLPGECFVEYQLRAQRLAAQGFVATAAYGDGGPWYIPIEEEYANGGYEVGVAFSDPPIDHLLTTGMKQLLSTG